MSMAIKFGRVGDMQWSIPFHKVTKSFDHMVLQGHVKHFSFCMTTTTKQNGKMVIHYKKPQPIKSHNPLNTWSCEVTWQIKNILSPLPQYLWPPNLAGWLHTMKSFLSQSYNDPLITWSSDFDFSYPICRFRMQTSESPPSSRHDEKCSSILHNGINILVNTIVKIRTYSKMW